MRLLVAGPWVGEIGWELMSWQGRVRRVFATGRFDRLVVVGAAGREAFYEDMPLRYESVELTNAPGAAYEDRRYDATAGGPVDARLLSELAEALASPVIERCREQGHTIETLRPGYDGRIWRCDRRDQTFITFRRPSSAPPPSPWIVLVKRTRNHGHVNWTANEWDELAAMLNARGMHTTEYPTNAAQAIAALSDCDLAVGQSTGGMHLASLCRCPHVVWAQRDPQLWRPLQFTNRQRYETVWNPLATPMEYHGLDGLPSVEQATDWTVNAMKQIGRRTGSRVAQTRMHAVWRVRRAVFQGVTDERIRPLLPWRVAQALRYQFV